MSKKICMKCKTIFPDTKENFRKTKCPNCEDSILYFLKKYTCEYCGKEFDHISKKSSNKIKYDSEECRNKAMKIKKEYVTKKKCDELSERYINKFKIKISKKLMDIIEQEILTNGEEGLIEIIKKGRIELFKHYSSMYEDNSSEYYTNHFVKKIK